MQRIVLCRSRRELSNAYLFAKIVFDTAENEPCTVSEIAKHAFTIASVSPSAELVQGGTVLTVTLVPVDGIRDADFFYRFPSCVWKFLKNSSKLLAIVRKIAFGKLGSLMFSGFWSKPNAPDQVTGTGWPAEQTKMALTARTSVRGFGLGNFVERTNYS